MLAVSCLTQQDQFLQVAGQNLHFRTGGPYKSSITTCYGQATARPREDPLDTQWDGAAIMLLSFLFRDLSNLAQNKTVPLSSSTGCYCAVFQLKRSPLYIHTKIYLQMIFFNECILSKLKDTKANTARHSATD